MERAKFHYFVIDLLSALSNVCINLATKSEAYVWSPLVFAMR